MTEEDEEAVDEEFAAILNEQMPEVPVNLEPSPIEIPETSTAEPSLPEVPTGAIEGNYFYISLTFLYLNRSSRFC